MSFLSGGGLDGYGNYNNVEQATEGSMYDLTYNTYNSDVREAMKLENFVPRPDGDQRPWFERVAEYGLTRAIDSNFGPPPANKTQQPASFAGQNGRTYAVGNATQPPATQSGGGMLPLVLAGAVALLALA